MNDMKSVKIDAILPVRVTGKRLYGKPLQLLDIENEVTILDYLVKYIRTSKHIGEVCLAIADSEANYIFAEVAEKNGWRYVFGDEDDMLGRIVKAGKELGTDVIFKGSTESPFLYHNGLDKLIEQHVAGGYDLSKVSNLPEGSGFSINSISALDKSHKQGSTKHRSELVHLYINENQGQFKINTLEPPVNLKRSSVRITVDYPEDLVFCRIVYQALKGADELIAVSDIVKFWDGNPVIRKPMEEIGIDWGHGRIWE
jgi:spore coat polysaccharide biosynthesis protein SpsF